MKPSYYIFVCLFFLFSHLPGQTIFKNSLPGEDVLSLQIIKDNQLTTSNFIVLNKKDDFLTVSFDIAGHTMQPLRYSLTHCDASWQSSGLYPFEYMENFSVFPLTNYRFSQNTIPLYTHYRLQIPNKELRPLLSGNYALTVFDENYPDQPLLTACFYVVETIMKASGIVVSHSDRKYQQLQLDISPIRENDSHYSAEHLKIFVKQNNRTDNSVQLPVPYQNQPGLLFEAGNEYRTVEFLSSSQTGKNIGQIVFRSPDIHIYLLPDKIATSYRTDQKGRDQLQTEANYYNVHFCLDFPYLPGGDIYLNGEFLHNEISGKSRMEYNYQTQQYQKILLLKGGSYNYQYLFVPHESRKGSTTEIEGNYYETGNEYTVLIYYSPPGAKYDRLIGYSVISSTPVQ